MNAIRINDDNPCAFCDYLAGRRPYTILRRNDVVATLVTREQRGEGHLLVMPVEHVPTLLECDAATRHALIDEVHWASTSLDLAFGRPGIAIWQNNGEPANQVVPHLHFHVAGTLKGGGTEFGEVPELSVEETDRIANAIRRAQPPVGTGSKS